MIKAVIFDMDGVLYNSMPMHLKIWEDLFNERNIPFNLKIFEEYNGHSSKEICEKLIKKYNLKENVEDFLSKKIDKEIEMRDELVDLFPETITVLKKLREENYKVAIATGALHHTVEYVEKRFNLDNYCDVFVESKDVSKGKPEPDIFILAATKLGVDKNQCIVIEDAPNGIEASNKAEIISVALTTTSPKESFGKADFIINNLNEIFKVLKELN